MDEVEAWRKKKLDALRRQRRMCMFGRIAMILFGTFVCAGSALAWRFWECNGLIALILIGCGLEFCWVGFTARTRS